MLDQLDEVNREGINSALPRRKPDLQRVNACLQANNALLRGWLQATCFRPTYPSQRAQAQVQTIYSRIAQKDNMLNVQIAEASQRDNAAIKAIAEDSKMVALTTSRDSAVMRTITAVTILFLPATFTTVHWPALPVIFYTSAAAAILSNIPEANTRALAHRPFTTVKPPTPTLSFPTGWLYWVVTIALTFLIQADWYFTTKRRGRQFTRDFCRRDHELYVLSNGF